MSWTGLASAFARSVRWPSVQVGIMPTPSFRPLASCADPLEASFVPAASVPAPAVSLTSPELSSSAPVRSSPTSVRAVLIWLTTSPLSRTLRAPLNRLCGLPSSRSSSRASPRIAVSWSFARGPRPFVASAFSTGASAFASRRCAGSPLARSWATTVSRRWLATACAAETSFRTLTTSSVVSLRRPAVVRISEPVIPDLSISARIRSVTESTFWSSSSTPVASLADPSLAVTSFVASSCAPEFTFVRPVSSWVAPLDASLTFGTRSLVTSFNAISKVLTPTCAEISLTACCAASCPMMVAR